MRRLPPAIVCVLVVCCPLAATADVDEVVDQRFVDAPPAAAEMTVAWYGRGRPRPTPPRQLAALTSWRVDWSLLASPRLDGGCVATNVKTSLAVSITLPRLPPPDALPQPHLERLQQHEAGHLQIARAAARRIDADLLALAPMADCEALQQEAARRATAHLERLQSDQAAYDVLTEHGQRQQDFQHAAMP